MKKLYVFVLVAMGLLIGLNLYNGNQNLSDEELVSMYLAEEHSDNNYDKLVVSNVNQDEFVEYKTFTNDKLSDCGCINKNYYTNRYAK